MRSNYQAFLGGLVLVILVGSSHGHICTIIPSQRGGFNISGPGNPSCFAPTAPCGGATPWWSRPIGAPVLSIVGGTTFRVLFLQNLNHYTVGNPGFMQIGFSCGTSQTSDADFAALAHFPDTWEHFQAAQTNYSIPIRLSTNCTHGTLQVIYNPLKPEEPIFHECSDVAVIPFDPDFATKLIQGSLVGVAEDGSQVFDVSSFNGLIFNDGKAAPPTQVLLGTGISDMTGQTLFLSYSSGPDAASVLTRSADSVWTSHQSSRAAIAGTTFEWVSLVYRTAHGQLLALGMLGNGTDNYYYWLYDVSGPTATLLGKSPLLEGEVNYMWSTYDPSSDKITVLTGNEDAPFDLNASLVVFNVAAGTSFLTTLDVSSYTFQSFQSIGGQLFALSPGLVTGFPHQTVHEWSLVRFDDVSGLISSAVPLSSTTAYLPLLNGRYSGGITGGITSAGLIAQSFYRYDDDAPLIAYLNLKGQVLWSTFLDDSQYNKEIQQLIFVTSQ